MNCERLLRHYVYAFLDDELTFEESLEVQAHIDACEACAERVGFEASFGRAIQRALPRVQAPSRLQASVRRSLRREQRQQQPWSWILRRGGTAVSRLAIAAALLFAIALPPDGIVHMVDLGLSGFADSVRGMLVCYHCAEQGVPVHLHRDCDAPGHLTGFRADDGSLWRLMENDVIAPAMLFDPGPRGQRVAVDGRFMSDYGYLQVDRLRFL